MKTRVLECGCTFTTDDDWTPCTAHVGSKLYRVRKAHAEVVTMVSCGNCGHSKAEGGICFNCGESERVG